MISFLWKLLLVPSAFAQVWIFAGNSWLNTTALDLGSGNTTKYVSFGNNHDLSYTDDWTICVWHYPHSAWEAPVFSKENGSTSNGWDLRYKTNNTYQWYSSGSGATRRIQWTSSGTSFTTGTWRHVCVTNDGAGTAAGMAFIVDGASETKTTNFSTSTEDWTTSANFKIAAWDNLTTYGRAKVDEMTIWNDNLTTTEIAELISGGHPANPARASFWASKNISYYRLGDLTDSTSTIYDRGVVGGVDGTGTSLSSGDFVTSVP